MSVVKVSSTAHNVCYLGRCAESLQASTAQTVELSRDDIARATIVIHESGAYLACSVNGQTEHLPQPLRFRA